MLGVNTEVLTKSPISSIIVQMYLDIGIHGKFKKLDHKETYSHLRQTRYNGQMQKKDNRCSFVAQMYELQEQEEHYDQSMIAPFNS